jgi:DNA-binding CsgD family transcriptional regulator
MGLSEKDLRRVLDVVSPEAVASEVGEMPHEVLRGLSELIPSAGVSFVVWDESKREILTCHRVCLTDDPGWDDGMAELFWGGYDECKAVSGLSELGESGQVNVWQDYYSHRQFARSPMYELYRRQGTYHRMMVRLRPRRGLERRLQITREPGDVGFTERDKMLMRLLRPHLTGIRDRIESDRDGAALLTPRQRELLRLVAGGSTNRQIGRELGVSEGTVRKHLENVYARLGVQNRTQAIAKVATR